MLIDASHPEETRVVVTRGNRVEEFDFESASRKQLRGNIYLAKVTRVEPSLQACFVDFGGNRHGFLAFSEIHPDYYQIPVADREALIAEEIARAMRDEEEEDAGSRQQSDREQSDRPERSNTDRNGRGRSRGFLGRNRQNQSGERSVAKQAIGDESVSGELEEQNVPSNEEIINIIPQDQPALMQDDHTSDNYISENHALDNLALEDEHHYEPHEEQIIEQVGAGDAMEDVPTRRYVPRRHYKIQEVIKRRQILLIQVVKEERGNKGAALTTYLSLAGRYSVLMPNTARGGGISRKITSGADRKRLKELVSDLEVPQGMGVILRTAGAARTKPEIKRDYEYLMRVWEKVRELTLQSSAPALVYEEGSLVKRSIRDLYTKDIDDVQVAGEASYREAKDFMRMLMPSHAKIVQHYRDGQPLFTKYGVEEQLDAMFSNNVTLRSGGYIVINQTEALVSIDVNSGRSTREHNIEDTAIKTNLEAAEEVARQLRLRDLAGLVVIDFIDMDEHRNNRAVERKLKDCLSGDRARIQVGRISPFGLMEMSRQRIRTGVLESSTVVCIHCAGTGLMRATPSIALQVLRAVEDALLKIPHHNIIVRTRTEIALYVLNHKRANLSALETAYGVSVMVQADESVVGSTHYIVERGEFVEEASLRPMPILTAPIMEELEPEIEDDLVEEVEAAPVEEDRQRSQRRNNRGRGRFERNQSQNDELQILAPERADIELTETDVEGDDAPPVGRVETEEEAQLRRRRRRRRGGRRNRRDRDDEPRGEIDAETGEKILTPIVYSEPVFYAEALEYSQKLQKTHIAEPVIVQIPVEVEMDQAQLNEPVVKAKRGRPAKIVDSANVADPSKFEAEIADEESKPAAKRGRKLKEVIEPKQIVEPEVLVVAEAEDPNKPKRTGWWAKTKQVITGG